MLKIKLLKLKSFILLNQARNKQRSLLNLNENYGLVLELKSQHLNVIKLTGTRLKQIKIWLKRCGEVLEHRKKLKVSRGKCRGARQKLSEIELKMHQIYLTWDFANLSPITTWFQGQNWLLVYSQHNPFVGHYLLWFLLQIVMILPWLRFVLQWLLEEHQGATVLYFSAIVLSLCFICMCDCDMKYVFHQVICWD